MPVSENEIVLYRRKEREHPYRGKAGPLVLVRPVRVDLEDLSALECTGRNVITGQVAVRGIVLAHGQQLVVDKVVQCAGSPTLLHEAHGYKVEIAKNLVKQAVLALAS